LRANVALNGLHDRIIVHECAAGATAGTVQLELSATNYGDHRVKVSDEDGAMAEKEREIVTVISCPLDTLCPEAIGANVMLWIDTQGFEGFVLAGATRILANHPPAVVELWPYGLARSGAFPALLIALKGYSGFYDLADPTEFIPMAKLECHASKYGTDYSAFTDILAL